MSEIERELERVRGEAQALEASADRARQTAQEPWALQVEKLEQTLQEVSLQLRREQKALEAANRKLSQLRPWRSYYNVSVFALTWVGAGVFVLTIQSVAAALAAASLVVIAAVAARLAGARP